MLDRWLGRDRIIAGANFNRWLIPPAALAIHLCIGMAYGFSVFWLPLSRSLGVTAPIACAPDTSVWTYVFTTTCDWPQPMLGWTYTLFFVLLGSAAALFGHWLETAGPRKAGVVSALCWSGGLLLGALGVHIHQLWLLWLGCGVIGGFGLGLGYISPVSTLIKWFPDRRGMATGLAIMGFGGGAMIGSPLADRLMQHFATPTSVGVAPTLVTLALLYLVAMLLGAFGYRVPPTGWTPAGWTAPPPAATSLKTSRHVNVDRVWGIPQFWLLWAVLCLNVSAGIGVLGMASPMLQEVFGGRLLGVDGALSQLAGDQRAQVATIGAAFAGLLSLFNIFGRIGWASFSDAIGRKATYFVFFALGIVLYGSAPWAGGAGQVALFVAIFCIILTMYGGGFATIPAYLADLFGTQHVGAIHGRLLTAWSVAGVLGPVVVNYIRQHQIDRGLPADQAYNMTLYILAAFLVLGFFCNLLVRPVADRHFMSDAELAAERAKAHEAASGAAQTTSAHQDASGALRVTLAWLAVGIPLLWGIWMTLTKALPLFRIG
ncbi:MAG: OFA family MFS transporter [Gammaproteobacteria bacterium]|nr:OFA family MFS transporter [Gammaproteobacteria bacterium]